ncbi:MAG: NUDIX domain-containing protein [Candidatus Limnocylindria bacterium]
MTGSGAPAGPPTAGPPPDERILVVPRDELPDLTDWHGVRADGIDVILRIVRERARPHPRSLAETDPFLKQIIPYLVLRDGDRYFLMQRTRAGTDARLHDRWSIGIGGHLDAGDGDVDAGLRREWHEELVADFDPEAVAVGVLNDDTTDVGAVHLGIVFVADAGGRPVGVRETAKLRGSFEDPRAVHAVVDRLETWSALVFDHLERVAGVER